MKGFFTSEFMTQKKLEVLETFEKILPLTSEHEDELLNAYMEGILKFKTHSQKQTQQSA